MKYTVEKKLTKPKASLQVCMISSGPNHMVKDDLMAGEMLVVKKKVRVDDKK